MKHKHRITIYRGGLDRWYVSCERCGDKWMAQGPDGFFGRTTWGAAFALGVTHQKEHGVLR